jgi:2-amino-4-hydroxy-6-hydroxymethyldihydropteridine diphosphokinase
MSITYIGMGSNIGDRVGYIQQAHMLLSDTEGIKVLNSSSIYETEPVGCENQEWFINAVLEIQTSLKPRELLKECFRIETQLGRTRNDDIEKWAPRTIDLDILFYDNLIIADDKLQIPHHQLHSRAFVLVPLLELAPDFIHPALEKSIEDLYNDLPAPEEVYLYGTRPIDI